VRPLPELQRIAAFREALRRLERTTERASRAVGVTPRQYQLLLAVAGAPDGSGAASVGDLASRLHLAQNTVSGLLERAEAAGLVSRSSSSADGRVVRVELTPSGRRALEATMRLLDEDRRAVAEAADALLRQLAWSVESRPR
jgi:DNA-binding MarR family transcriptional regulator